ncbi:MAG: hypothetical protein R3C14_49625 [Caldilineaceae bacterium]
MNNSSINQPVIRPGGLSLRVNFSWTFAGNVVYAASQWGILIVLSKLGTPEIVGQFALALAVTAPIFMFANLKLRSVQATDALDEYLFGEYLGLRLLTTVIGFGIVGVVSILAGYDLYVIALILLIGLAKSVESVSDICYGLFQKVERMDQTARSLIWRGTVALVVMALLLFWTGNILYGAAGLVLVWFTVFWLHDIPQSRLILGGGIQQGMLRGLSRHKLLQLAWLALPLGVTMFLVSLNTNIPRYFAEASLGSAALGVYAAIAYIQAAGSTFVEALGASINARMAHYYAAQNRGAYFKLLMRLVGISSLLALGGITAAALFGKPLLTLLYRAEYADQTLFLLLMIAAGMSYIASALNHAMTAARRYRVQVPIFGAVTLSVVAVCAWAVPRYGLYGAAAAQGVGMSVQVLASLLVVVAAMRKAKV